MQSDERWYVRARGLTRLIVAVSMATAGIALGLSAAGDRSPSAQLLSYRRTIPATPPSGAYLTLAKIMSSEIAAKIGHTLSLSLSVVVNKKQLEGDALAYAVPFDSTGGTTGPATSCVIHINPSLSAESWADHELTLAHEVFHCFEFMDYPTITALDAAPNWLIEGEAEWVGETLYPTTDGFWNPYLTDINRSLFARSYDAIGFYAHMTNSGEDTWHLLDPMLKAGSSAAAYNLAANSTLRLTWASSLARQTSFGSGWNTTGPGITDATDNPGVHNLLIGTDLSATVAPYTNALVEFRTSADIVDISASTPYSRLHEANGTDLNHLNTAPNVFCANDCTQCQAMEALPKLPLGTTWLAVTGDSTGARYSIAGAKATCGACLVGSWTATNFILTTNPGGTHSGGVGTRVEIYPDGTAVGDFTPGAPLEPGDIKFYGTQSAHYGFLANTTARSGTFPVSDTAGGLISVGGSPPVGIANSPSVSGSYSCIGTGLTLRFSLGSSELVYVLTPAAPSTPSPAPPTTP